MRFSLGREFGVEFHEPGEFVTEESTSIGRPLGDGDIRVAAVIPATKLVQSACKGDDRGFGVGERVRGREVLGKHASSEVGLAKGGGVGEISLL